MRGRYKVSIKTNRVQYDFCVRRNLTIINGESGTGKSVLYEIVEAVANKIQGILTKVSPLDTKNVPKLNVLTDNNWELIMKNTKNTIFFIDEFSKFMFSNEFSMALGKNDNYFVIITRHSNKLCGLPISINEIYDIHTSGKFHTLKPKYRNCYINQKDLKVTDSPYFLTEDTGSGRSFFKNATGSTHVIGAEGNGDISNKIVELLNNKCDIVIIVDAAAFGAFMEGTLNVLKRTNRNIKFLLPESFEYLLLTTPMFAHCYSYNMHVPYAVVESSEYKSWERFYTETLKEYAKQFGFSYSKRRGLPNRLKSDAIASDILNRLKLI